MEEPFLQIGYGGNAAKKQQIEERSARHRRKYENQNRGERLHRSESVDRGGSEENGVLRISSIISALRQCRSAKDLPVGKRIHLNLVKDTKEDLLRSNVFVASALVDMYAKCGSLVDAHRVFRGMEHHDVVSWNCMIQAFARNGDGKQALEYFRLMKEEGCVPNRVTFLATLKACVSLGEKEEAKLLDGKLVKLESLTTGREIHAQVESRGLQHDLYVSNSLIDTYSKAGSMDDARRVFDGIRQRSVVSWTSLINGFAENGDGALALDFYERMKGSQGCQPNRVTLLAALKACVSLAEKEDGKLVDGKMVKVECLGKGRAIHDHAVKTGEHLDVFVASSLVDMYSKCGNMAEARQVFEAMEQRTVVSWTALIMGYAQSGQENEALLLYSRMQASSCQPNRATILGALKACASLAEKESGKTLANVSWSCLEKGKSVHLQAARSGLDSLELSVANSLIDMYAKCGSMADACRVFESMAAHDEVSWNCKILGYAENGDGEQALTLYEEMQQEALEPNRATFLAALKACVTLAEMLDGDKDRRKVKQVLEKGRKIHSRAGGDGNNLETMVANTLVDLYSKCGNMCDAQEVFRSIEGHSIVSWNCIISGYAENGDAETALEYYKRMRDAGYTPDSSTFIAVLKACSHLGDLDAATQIHSEIKSAGLQNEATVGNVLIDCFGKCGSMVHAEQAFESIRHKNSVSWSSLIAGYSLQGDAERVFELFERMEEQERRERSSQMLQPNDKTMLYIFTSILSVCRHAGLIDRAEYYFEKMRAQFNITPTIQHFTCMVDLLGRVNRLEEAVEMVTNMPAKADTVIWMTLLDSAWRWKNLRVARIAFEEALKLDATNASAYVLMTNIYASLGMRDEAARVQSRLIRD